jgi:aspartate-semialdehyde dehydrogenase
MGRKNGIPVAILGATGAVGQKFVELLEHHPWFDLTTVAASGRSAGRRYGDAVQWQVPKPIPERAAALTVQECKPRFEAAVVFSALPASEAVEVEPAFAEAGYAVVSNASSHRMAPDVPLLIPEVNPDHVALIETQSWFEGGGFIVTNPNCSTTGLVATLRPLHDRFGLETVQATTLQALSGAGYPGVASLDAVGNVLPFIPNEEDKLESEPAKLLGQIEQGRIEPAGLTVSAQCNRVPVVDGHLVCVSIEFTRAVGPAEVQQTLQEFRAPEDVAILPSAPETFIQVFDEPLAPQPRKHVDLGEGMTVSVGRLRPCPINHVKYVALVHNTVRGAAGGAILNAELLVSRGYLGDTESLVERHPGLIVRP